MIYDLPRIIHAITAGEILQTMDALSKADMRTQYGGHFAADFETVVMFCAGKHIGAQEERARAASLGRFWTPSTSSHPTNCKPSTTIWKGGATHEPADPHAAAACDGQHRRTPETLPGLQKAREPVRGNKNGPLSWYLSRPKDAPYSRAMAIVS